MLTAGFLLGGVFLPHLLDLPSSSLPTGRVASAAAGDIRPPVEGVGASLTGKPDEVVMANGLLPLQSSLPRTLPPSPCE